VTVSSPATNRGRPILTRSGALWYPRSPLPSDVRVADFPALARLPRWSGHTLAPYSVAEHSVRCVLHLDALGASAPDLLGALVHDLHEIYPPGDVPGPVLRDRESPWSEALRAMEERARDALRTALSLPLDLGPAVRHADLVLLATEARDLMPPSDVWAGAGLPAPLAERIEPWGEEQAWRAWAGWWTRLGGRVGR
jgi:hypothetical protein